MMSGQVGIRLGKLWQIRQVFGQNVRAVNVGVVDPRIFCDVVPLPTSAHPQSNQIRTSMRGQTAVAAGLEGNLLLLSVCPGHGTELSLHVD